MYLIKAGSLVVYDSTDLNTYPVLSPSLEEELNGAGTLTFTLLPGHPNIDALKEMQTYVTAWRDDEEIFYGRVLTTSTLIDGQLEVTCEGNLTFFMDSEVSKGTYNETVAAFLSRLIDNHNSQTETAKHFHLGEVTVPKAIEIDEETHQTKKWEFKIGGFATTKSTLESLILGQFGGYLRVRPDGQGGHLLDYIKDFSRPNVQPIRIGHNIVDKSEKRSGEAIFTKLRPIYGENSTIEGLTQADVTLPNVTIDGPFLVLNDLLQRYGTIVHTESFEKEKEKVTTKKACLAKAEEFIQRMGTQVPSSCDISFVDFYHLNAKDFRERQEESREVDYAHLQDGITFQLGNVDLFNRPVIPLQKMVDAGWENGPVDPDAIATLYSVTYTGGYMNNINPGASVTTGLITPQSDGSFVINGSPASATSYFFKTSSALKERAVKMPPGTYTVHAELLSGQITGQVKFGYWYWEGTSGNDHSLQDTWTSGASLSRTFTGDAYLLPYMYFGSNVNAQNARFGLKIERGAQVTPFAQDTDYCMDENCVWVASPILPYGDVLTPAAFEDYFNGLVDGGARTKSALLAADNMNNGGKGLIIGLASMVGTPAESIGLAGGWAEAVHEEQEWLYDIYVPDVRLGDVFTNIEGYPGVTMTVSNMSIDMSNPGNDSMTLKNREELDSSGVTSNSLTVIESKYAKQETFRYKTLQETLDKESSKLSITASELEIVSKNVLQVLGNSMIIIQPKSSSAQADYVIKAVSFSEDPTKPGEYVPTFSMNVNGIQLTDGYEMVNEDGEKIAGKAALAVERGRINAEITRAEGEENALKTRLTLTETDIGLEVSRAQSAEGALSSRIDMTDSNLALKVSAGDIASSLNMTPQSVQIQASKIDLSGYVTANYLSTHYLSAETITSDYVLTSTLQSDYLTADQIEATYLTAEQVEATYVTSDFISGSYVEMASGNLVAFDYGRLEGNYIGAATGTIDALNSDSVTTAALTLNGHAMSAGVINSIGPADTSSSSGQVVIPWTKLDGTSGQISFNIASMAAYQQAVEAAEMDGASSLAGSWSQNQYTATTQVGGVAMYNCIGYFTLPNTIGSSRLHSPSRNAIDIDITANVGSAPGGAGTPYTKQNVLVDATPAYNAGKEDVGITGYWDDNVYRAATTGKTVDDTVNSGAITAGQIITYNTGFHTYTIRGTAIANGGVIYTSSGVDTNTDAYDAGRAAITLTDDWQNNTWTVSTSGKVQNDSASITLTAVPNITYDSSTHTYTATADALADGTTKYTSTGVPTGTEAYDDGRAAVGIRGYWDNNIYRATTTGKAVNDTADSGAITAGQIISYNSGFHTYTVRGTAIANGGVIYTSSGADTNTQAYDDGRAAIGITGSWNGATYTATTVGKVTESTATTTLTAHDVYQATNGRTIYPRGNTVTVSNYTRTAVDTCGTGHRVPLTLSGPHTIVDEDGSVWRNMYRCSNWDTLYEKKTSYYFDDDGTESTYYRGATGVYVYDRGSKETYYTIPT